MAEKNRIVVARISGSVKAALNAPFRVIDAGVGYIPVITIPLRLPSISHNTTPKKSAVQKKHHSSFKTLFPTFYQAYTFFNTTEVVLPRFALPQRSFLPVLAFAQNRPNRRNRARTRDTRGGRPTVHEQTPEKQKQSTAPTQTPSQSPLRRYFSDGRRVLPFIILLLLVISVIYQLYHKVQVSKPQPSTPSQSALALSSPISSASPLPITAQSAAPSPSVTPIPTLLTSSPLATTKASATMQTKPTSTAAPKASGNISQQAASTTAKTYTVRAGDTLWDIAQSQTGSGFNWKQIAQANNISNPTTLSSGTTLSIPQTVSAATTLHPKATSYTVKAGDTLWDIAQSEYGNPYAWASIAQANNLQNPSIIHSGNVLSLPQSVSL